MKRRGFLGSLVAAFAVPLDWVAPAVTVGRKLLNRNAASAPENRLHFPGGDLVLKPDETVLLHYRDGQWVAEHPQT